MGKPVVVEILDHKAEIKWIKGQKPDAILRNDYSLSVFVEFDEPVDGTQGFGFTIPVKNYGKEELRETIERQGEITLLAIQKNSRRLRDSIEREEARIKELDEFGSKLVQMLSDYEDNLDDKANPD